MRTRLLILCSSISVSVTAILGGVLYARLWDDRLKSIEQSIATQLRDIAFSLGGLFEEVEADLTAMADNELVRTRDDRDFTSFLAADEQTFQYHYAELEKKIIAIFNGYRVAHRYVNSVYMGRENGSFVRSHPRVPTQYDPRERPWYVAAKANPREVVETDAYPSLTTNDVNIGVVKALVDDSGRFFGVVGIDVTLVELTEYINNFGIGPAAALVVLDRNGQVLAARDATMRSASIDAYSPELRAILSTRQEGSAEVSFRGEKHFVFFQPPTRLGWRIAVFVPSREIGAQARTPVITMIAGLAAGWLLLTALVLAGLEVMIVRPLRRLTEETDHVARTANLDRRIDVRSRGEIGALGESYNRMIDSLRQAHESLEKGEGELTEYRDHLEELVRQRAGELQDANRRLKKEIAERIVIQEALAEREAQYHDLVESANSIILRWLPDGRVLSINKFAQSFFGYTEKEILGQNIVGTVIAAGGPNRTDPAALLHDIVSHPETHVRSVNENTRKNRERVWVAWSNKPILGKDGQIGEVLSIGVDITQLVRTERELRHALEELASAKERAETADRLKSAFLATMSHELRTPLNSIIGFTGILLQEMVGPLSEEQRKQLGMVRGSAQHLLSLISDVLDISKIEAGQMTVAREPVDLPASVRKVIETVQPLAAKKGLKLELSIATGVGTIWSDTRRFEQILLNILSNAVKFTEQGSVSVTCSSTPGAVVVQVTDTGIGIGEADLARVFVPFQQIDTGLARKYEGTGLGLSICKRLVELLGGTIWAQSEKDTGSTFCFSLPSGEIPS